MVSRLQDRPDEVMTPAQAVGLGWPVREDVRSASHRKGGQPAIGSITAPLATLLHRRHELRDAVAAADLIDAAVRDCA